MHVKLSSPCRARMMRVHATAKDHRPYLLKPELKVRMRSDVISLQLSRSFPDQEKHWNRNSCTNLYAFYCKTYIF